MSNGFFSVLESAKEAISAIYGYVATCVGIWKDRMIEWVQEVPFRVKGWVDGKPLHAQEVTLEKRTVTFPCSIFSRVGWGYTRLSDCGVTLSDKRSAYPDSTGCVICVQKDDEYYTLTGDSHEKEITCLTVLPNNRLASGSEDHTVKIWNVKDGQKNNCEFTLQGHKDVVTRLIAYNNNRLASASLDGTVRIWDTGNGVRQNTIEFGSAVTCLTVFDRRLIVGTERKEVKIWNVVTGQIDKTIVLSAIPTCLQPLEGSQVVVGDVSGRITFLNYATNQSLQTEEKHNGLVIGFLPKITNDILCSFGLDGKEKLWNIKSKEFQNETLVSFGDFHSFFEFHIGPNRFSIPSPW